jgi:hypothetical protein
MNTKYLFLMVGLFLSGFVAAPISHSPVTIPFKDKKQIVIYETNFNSLKRGLTQPFPGENGQDAWFSELAVSPGYGEIQNKIARPGQALHEFTSSSVPGLIQTVDKRLIAASDLSQYPVIKIQVDFYAHTSDLNARNIFGAVLALTGGPHPGFEILAFSLNSGNGTPKGEAGVNMELSTFNGIDNNEPIPLQVGQNLAWDKWHRIVLVASQSEDRYVSLKVDGHVEDLSAYALPRSEVSIGVWERGMSMEEIQAVIAPNMDFESVSEDDIYWDNLQITVSR